MLVRPTQQRMPKQRMEDEGQDGAIPVVSSLFHRPCDFPLAAVRYLATVEACNQGAPFMQLKSTLTCPKCGHRSVETMPTDACQFFYDCKGCGERLKPLAGDCCVFCSYGSVPCPPVQESKKCC